MYMHVRCHNDHLQPCKEKYFSLDFTFFFMPFYFNFVSWVGHKKKKYFQNKISLILLKLIFVLETIFILEEFNVNPLNLRKSLCRYVNTLHASNCFCCYVWAKGELRRIERIFNLSSLT